MTFVSVPLRQVVVLCSLLVLAACGDSTGGTDAGTGGGGAVATGGGSAATGGGTAATGGGTAATGGGTAATGGGTAATGGGTAATGGGTAATGGGTAATGGGTSGTGGGTASPSVTTATLPNGVISVTYSATLAASGGATPYTWTITSGQLPTGLSLDAATGTITGSPSEVGTSSFVVLVADSSTPAQTATASLSLAINPALAVTTLSLPSGVVNTASSQQLLAAGGTAPYTWALDTGTLPAGLALAADGTLAGTPTTAGTSTFTVTVTDSTVPAQHATSASLSLVINGAGVLTITTATLLDGVSNTPYSDSILAIGGTTPYTFTVKTGALPAGLNLSAGGELAGTPSGASSASVTIEVADSSTPQQVASQTFTLRVSDALAVATTSLPNAAAGTAYSATLTVSGGIAPASWALTGGALPAGLSLTSAGAIVGTPTASGTFSVTVQASDASTPAQTASGTLNLTVIPALIITSVALPNGVAGVAYSATLEASGGAPAYSWALAGGTLPTGLSLSSAGVLSGTSSQTGSFTVKISCTDSGTPVQVKTASFTFFINGAGTLTITTGSVPVATQNVAYSTNLAATGGTTPYTWSLSSGQLPAGLTLNATGLVSGTPTATGSFAFTAQVTDSSVPAKTATQLLQVVVLTQLTITTASLPAGAQNVAYNAALAASGGSTPYHWSISTGTLPTGLALSASTGVIAGLPTASGTFNFTVQVTDSGATMQTATKAFSVVISPPLSIVTTSPLAPAVVKVAHAVTFTATGGKTPYVWSVVPGYTLPAGMTLSLGGVLSGTPSTVGTATFRLQVKDGSNPQQVAARTFQLKVSPALVVTTTSLPSGTVAVPYTATLASTGGNGPFSWSVATGQLPDGLTLSAAGVLSGTPTTSAPYNFTVTVTDSTSPAVSATSSALSILVNAAGTLSVATTTLPDGVRTVAYPSTSLTASGGTGPFSWAVTGGALPAGLTLSAAGLISGTPTQSGAANFTVTVTDSLSATASRALTISIRQPLQVTSPATLPLAVVGSAYSVTLTGSGGHTPYTWSVTSGAAPAGLTVGADGVISGTPAGPTGAIAFTVTLTDSASPPQTVSKVETINVDAALSITTTALPKCTRGTAYTSSITATGGTAPLTFTHSLLWLPGLTLNATTGALTGTVPQVVPAGTYTLGFIVTDKLGQQVQKSLSLEVQ